MIISPEDLPTFHLCFFCLTCQIGKWVFQFYSLLLSQTFSSPGCAHDDGMIFSLDFYHHDGVYQSACLSEIVRFRFGCRFFEISDLPENKIHLLFSHGYFFTFGFSSTIWSRSWSDGVCWRFFGVFSFDGGKQYSWPSELTVASNKCFGGNGSSVYDRKVNTFVVEIKFKPSSLEVQGTLLVLTVSLTGASAETIWGLSG